MPRHPRGRSFYFRTREFARLTEKALVDPDDADAHVLRRIFVLGKYKDKRVKNAHKGRGVSISIARSILRPLARPPARLRPRWLGGTSLPALPGDIVTAGLVLDLGVANVGMQPAAWFLLGPFDDVDIQGVVA